MNKRIVMSTHAIYNFKNRPLLAKIIKFILDRCDFVLAVGEPSLEELVAIGIPRTKLAVHPNWVDTDFFKPVKRQKHNPTLLFTGRAFERKGLFVFGELAKLFPKTQFIARVSEGPDLTEFIKHFSKLKNLLIHDKLPTDFDEKFKLILTDYQASDIFLMPSQYAEGFAAVITEAASTGLAIISSNLGSLPSILKNSGADLIDPTVEKFSKTIKNLLDDPKLLVRKQSEIRQFALENFSDKNAEVIYNSYHL